MINNCDRSQMEKLCRSCMCESTDVKNLFQAKDGLEDQTHLIADMFMACASVEISMNDPLPKIICTQCELKLSVAFDFKRQCEKADDSLRRLASLSSKEEIEIKPDVNDYYDEDNDNDTDSDSSTGSKGNKGWLRCRYCLKGFRQRGRYRTHMQSHKNEKLHPCHICHKKFSKDILHKHLHTAHKTDAECNSFPCEQCDLHFMTAYLLSKHMKEHKNQLDAKDQSRNDDDIDVSEYLEDECPDIEIEDNSEKEKYECKFCSKILTTTVGLKIHMRRHTGRNLHSCGVCKKTFTKSNHLKRHMLTHGVKIELKNSTKRSEKDKKIMQCEFCDRQFKYRKSFTHHMLSEHGVSDDSDTPLNFLVIKRDENREAGKDAVQVEKECGVNDLQNEEFDNNDKEFSSRKTTKSHTCHVCKENFDRSNHLTRHMIFHKAVLIHKCNRCDKAFATPEYLKKHAQEDHIEKPYACTLCNKTYSRGELLIRHLKVHLTPSEINIKCSICEKEFSRSDHLARHTKIHLQQDKRHTCGDCGKAFNRLDNLKTHQRVHTGQPNHPKLHLCIYCGKEFNNSSNMIVHMRRHTGEKPYKCSHCDKGFPRSHDLKCHERTHSGEKPYMCNLCGKAFNKSNKLLRHRRVHTGERPYACSICSRAFTQSNDLALHMRRHTGARPYACGMCPARFIQSGQLKTHRRSTGHWLETQPDLKGGHRVEPVVPLINPVPIRFKTHGKTKGEEESNHETAEPTVLCKPISARDAQEAEMSFRSSDIAYNARENAEELSGRIKSEVHNNFANGVAVDNGEKERCEAQNEVNTFQMYDTNTPSSTAYSYTNYQSFG